MNKINYKVIFKGWNNDNDISLALTFRKLKSGEKNITISPKILSDLKSLSDINPKIFLFQNIVDVLITGGESMILNYVNYYVVLIKSKKNGKKEAILIGSRKRESDLEILGIWPFNNEKQNITRYQIMDTFHKLLDNPEIYENICIITT